MAITDSLSTPATTTTFDHNADCHIIVEFTYEAGQVLTTHFRKEAWNDTVVVSAASWGGRLELQYNDGSWHEVAVAGSAFSNGVAYKVDIYADGSSILVDVDDVNAIDETVTHNQTVANGGEVEHDYATNDIELESWPHGEPTDDTELVVSDCAHANSVDGTAAGSGAWEVGAYIYESDNLTIEVGQASLSVSDGTHVNEAGGITLGTGNLELTIDSNGKPIVSDDGTPIITGSNADVSEGDDVILLVDDGHAWLYVEGALIGSSAAVSANTKTQFTMTSIGTGGASDAVEIYPADTSLFKV